MRIPTTDEGGDPMAALRADPTARPLPTLSGKVELFSARIDGFALDDCPGHPAWMIAGREPMAIHPADAAARGICNGDLVRLFNDRGACLVGARLTRTSGPASSRSRPAPGTTRATSGRA